ncbi:ComEA family DNA-binding protein [Legionella bononiensis]|uniref:Helix-hairpin-helix domain-containing protein n=1 Tax=Legionella bononiensis TaxID=2793102 RepID=A0ABS1W838_9GAMM|nr:helix-hairpin-helix domain-containing protein [Legionella bononiensis]MBL7479977.1 helix-hairpin-helix domain-containing protein [Legionella bononiensis]MBL7525509.1 helix-hairpin-helix domain-containing protein [Legionella bononiensis]MBL7561692.1 helix-hairpin-helix domain-containing protein [Legionella bononiensis]
MKARFIAMLLSLFVVTLPVQADTVPKKQPEQHASSPGKIDLNQADLSTLTGSFKGIGKKRAEAIIAYRESHKGFKSLEELAEVKGFGQRFMNTNRDKLKEVFIIN